MDKVYYNPKTKEFGYFIKGEKNPQIHLKTEPNKLADYVGKDIAERLMQEPQKDGMHKYRDGLQVGGSGMKGFYGSPTENKLGIVDNVAKSLWGDVGTVEIPEGKGILGKPTVEQLTKARDLANKENDTDAVKFLQEQMNVS